MARKKKRPFRKAELKRWLYRRSRGKCHYCGTLLVFGESTIDHKRARSKGGTYDRKNVVLACKGCNAEKADGLYSKYKALWKLRLRGTEVTLQ